MAKIHIRYVTLQIGKQLEHGFADPKAIEHQRNLGALLSLTFINEFRSEGFETGYFKAGTLDLLDDALKILLSRIRPMIIPLAETLLAPFFPNEVLMTAIGNSYGDIYETHFEWAKNSRMNKT